MKLALGSVQFGLDYGISNTTGKVASNEVYQLLAMANQSGITELDTASSYGDSEKILGLNPNNQDFNYLGKISPDCLPENYLKEAQQSLGDLKQDRFEVISVHHGNILLADNGNEHYQALLNIKRSGFANKIGCSVYSPSEAIELLNKFDLDVIQLPASIFDQRIFDEKFKQLINHKAVEIHIRSLFLQGAVFLSPEKLPKKLKALAPKLEQLAQLSKHHQVSKLALILAPFVNQPLVSKIILGCISSEQLQQNLTAYEQAKSLNIDLSALAIDDEIILNPSKW